MEQKKRKERRKRENIEIESQRGVCRTANENQRVK